jgi:hypothetical protein
MIGSSGVRVRIDGRLTSSEECLRAIFRDYGIRWEVQKGVRRVEVGCTVLPTFSLRGTSDRQCRSGSVQLLEDRERRLGWWKSRTATGRG